MMNKVIAVFWLKSEDISRYQRASGSEHFRPRGFTRRFSTGFSVTVGAFDQSLTPSMKF
jgi:hypothetical protein